MAGGFISISAFSTGLSAANEETKCHWYVYVCMHMCMCMCMCMCMSEVGFDRCYLDRQVCLTDRDIGPTEVGQMTTLERHV